MTAVYDFATPIDRRGTGSSKWSKYGPDVLPMWVADMDFAVAPQIIAAINERLSHPVLGYGVARDSLRQQIIADLAERYDWMIQAEDIVFLPGVEPGFNMALNAMCKPGDGLLVQSPIYKPILNAASHWGLNRIDLPVDANIDAVFSNLVEGASAFLLCNPHNPTGKVYERVELSAMAEACIASGAVIISDEIHCDLVFDGRRHIPIASLSDEIAQRTVTLMAASKTYNIAGLKTAFAIVPNRDIREKFVASKLGLVDSVNVLGLEATLAAYRDCGDWKDAALAYLQANRDYLVEAVKTRLPGITMASPQSTFLAWLDCSALGLGGDAAEYFLRHGKVGFNSGSEFGAAYSDFVRLNFGCSRETLEDGICRMETALAAR